MNNEPKYIAYWTDHTIVPNPFWSTNNRNIEPETMPEMRQHIIFFYEDKKLAEFLSSKDGQRYGVQYYKIEKISPTVKVEVTLNV